MTAAPMTAAPTDTAMPKWCISIPDGDVPDGFLGLPVLVFRLTVSRSLTSGLLGLDGPGQSTPEMARFLIGREAPQAGGRLLVLDQTGTRAVDRDAVALDLRDVRVYDAVSRYVWERMNPCKRGLVLVGPPLIKKDWVTDTWTMAAYVEDADATERWDAYAVSMDFRSCGDRAALNRRGFDYKQIDLDVPGLEAVTNRVEALVMIVKSLQAVR